MIMKFEKTQCKIGEKLATERSNNANEQWDTIRNAIKSSAEECCGAPTRQLDPWISQNSLNLIHQRRELPLGSSSTIKRRQMSRQIRRSLRLDRENWWIQKAEEMETAIASGNIGKLFDLIWKTGGKKAKVSETIEETDGSLIVNQNRRMERWAEFYEDQFSRLSHAPVDTRTSCPQTISNVPMAPPCEGEVRCANKRSQRNKAAGPDELPPALFKDGGATLTTAITQLFIEIWHSEDVPGCWGESIVIPIFKKGQRTVCSNHRGVSLIPVISKLFALILLRRLTPSREQTIREQQGGFRPGRGCVDQIFTLRQYMEHRHTYHRATIYVFLDLKAAFDSVDRLEPFNLFLTQGVPAKYVDILKSTYAHTSGKVSAYGQLSRTFNTTSGVPVTFGTDTLSWCDGLCTSMTHWAILDGIFTNSRRASHARKASD